MKKRSTLLMILFALLATCALAQKTTEAESEETTEVQGPIIGIDLGTTFSCVGIWRNGKVDIIANDQGNRATPSYVAFTADGQRLVGDAAKSQASANPKNTVYDAKRLIGRDFNDRKVKEDAKLWPFDLKNVDGKPYIEVEHKGERRAFAPEEISASVLQKMKKIAEDYLGEEVKDAVVTVPAYFNDLQRQATKDAGTIAGLNVRRIINEPTAAAIAYGLDKQKEMNIVVYDLGGGTFDVSLLTVDDGVFEVLATDGDTHLGGQDFDHSVTKYFVKLFQKKHKIDLRQNDRAISKLRREVEKAKRVLSSQHQTKIDIENIAQGIDFSETLSRARFEELNNALFKKTMRPLKSVLSSAGLKKSDIDEVVLVGGSTRIPKIRELVEKFFGKKPSLGINPDEAVAYGAAVQAGVLAGEESKIVVLDITPLSLGIETVGGVMNKVIDKHSVIPTKKSQTYSTYQDNQEAVTINVFQGERALTKDCHKLGSFNLGGIEAAPRGVPQIKVTFNVDANSILTVEAVDEKTGKSADITITKEAATLTEDEMEEMKRNAEAFAEEDRDTLEAIDFRNRLESQALDIKNKLDEELSSLPEDDRETLRETCDEVLQFVDEIPALADSLEDYREKFAEWEDVVTPLLSDAHAGQGYEDDDEDWEHDEL